MRTGKELILATRPYAAEFTAKSGWCVLSTAFMLAAAFVGTLWNFHAVGKLICSVLAGLLMLRLLVIYHDQQHHAILSKSRLAERFMRVIGILSLSPSSGYHHIHHLNARVPFYRLPEVWKAIPELAKPKTTSLRVVDIFRCLRLKVWDVDAQQMAGLPKI